MNNPHGPLRVGVGGPVGSGKTALMDLLCKKLRGAYEIAAITNDIYTKWDAEYLVRSGALARRAHRRRRNRRLPAHRHPRGCFHQSRRGRRHARQVSRSRSGADRIRRRQSGRHVFSGTRRSHHLRHRRRRRRQDPVQRRPRHHALRSPGHQQDRSRSLRRRLARGHGARRQENARGAPLRVHQSARRQGRRRDRALHRSKRAAYAHEAHIRPRPARRRACTHR